MTDSSTTMIGFQCGGCGRRYSVPSSFAGRTAKCKTCGASVVVPDSKPVAAEGAAVAPAASTPMSTSRAQPAAPAAQQAPQIPMRLRRLRADAELMIKAFSGSGPIRLQSTVGDPPSAYRLEYRVRGLERGKRAEPITRDTHLVEIELTSDYPRMGPHCKMLTPIFHPNINGGTICVGDHWTAGERLVDLAARIGEMIAYQAYNIKSPLDGEAAMWADLHLDRIPIDPRPLRAAESV